MTATVSDGAITAIQSAADLADAAQRDLDRANEAARSAGNQTTIEKFLALAKTKALVSIAQSQVILAAQSVAQMAVIEEQQSAKASEGEG